MLGFASVLFGEGALRRRDVLGQGVSSEMVRMGLVRRVAWQEDIEDQQRSLILWQVGGWCAVGLGQARKRVRQTTSWPVRQSILGQHVGCSWWRTFGACCNCKGKINGLGDAFSGRARYVDVVEAIVLGGCANVPAVDAVTGPGAVDGRGFMDKDVRTG